MYGGNCCCGGPTEYPGGNCVGYDGCCCCWPLFQKWKFVILRTKILMCTNHFYCNRPFLCVDSIKSLKWIFIFYKGNWQNCTFSRLSSDEFDSEVYTLLLTNTSMQKYYFLAPPIRLFQLEIGGSDRDEIFRIGFSRPPGILIFRFLMKNQKWLLILSSLFSSSVSLITLFK